MPAGRSLRLLLLLVLIASPPDARAHDPSAYGGLFRSRDGGATWFPANPGRIVSGALAVAVSPIDPQHLLLATDSGLLRSRNGGLEWRLEAPHLLVGAVFAVAFAADGQRALAASEAGIFRGEDGAWRETAAPGAAMPARAIVASGPDRAYLVGWRGLYRSDDWGVSWSDIAPEPVEAPVTALSARPGLSGPVFAIAGRTLWTSADAGRRWRESGAGLPRGEIDTVTLDGHHPDRVWGAGRGRIFLSEDGGGSWQSWGRPIAEADIEVRGFSASGDGATAVVTTDRGLYRTRDQGARWEQIGETLPAHLEAGPLETDPADPSTLYAGFALTPYGERWRLAAERRSALARVGLTGLVGGAAFLVLLGLAAAAALRGLARLRPGGTAAAPARRRRGARA